VTAADTLSNEANQKSVFHLSRQQTIEIIECRNYKYNYVTGYNNNTHMFN